MGVLRASELEQRVRQESRVSAFSKQGEMKTEHLKSVGSEQIHCGMSKTAK